jgi:hypothetical protein
VSDEERAARIAAAPSWDALRAAAQRAFPGAKLLVRRRRNGTGVARLRYDGEGAGYHSDEMECEWTAPAAEQEARAAVDAAIRGLAEGWEAIRAGAS